MKRKKLSYKLLRILLVVMVLWCGTNFSSIKVQAATSANKEACKQELTEMLYSADSTTHNLYKYRLSSTEFIEIINSLKTGDTRLIWASYFSNMHFDYSLKYSKINEVNIQNIDNNVLSRYETLTNNIEWIRAGLCNDMSDLDKIIYLHNCLVEITSYKYNGYQSYGTCGALGENQAVCSGYAKALIMLLDMEGIEAKYTSSITLDHGWLIVNLDGEWYHIDPTWDDTRAAVKGQVGHQFLLRNDEEFSGWKSHVDWNDPGEKMHCTSTRFTDWYVHDITGKMIYDNGYWYYVDNTTNNLMKSTAIGDDMQIVVNGEGQSSFTLISVSDGIAVYTCDGEQYSSDELPEKEPASSLDTNTDISNETKEEASIDDTSESDSSLSTPDTSDEESSVSSEELPNILSVNMSNFGQWESGTYNTETSAFSSSATRIHLSSYCIAEPTTSYTAKLPAEDLAFCIHEFDSNFNLIVTHSIPDGIRFVTASNCKYLTVELFSPDNEWNYQYKSYKSLFSNGGLSIGLTKDTSPLVEDYMYWENISTWRIGSYNMQSGIYSKTPKTRICLNDYIYTKPNSSYSISINNESYRMMVTQYDSSYNLISSNTYENGSGFITNAKCYYLGISIFSPSLEWTLNYSSYEDLFANGFVTSLTRTKSGEEASEGDSIISNALYPSIATINMKNYGEWRIGQYNANSALYETSQTRICLNSYYAVQPLTKYTASLSDSNIAFFVHELDSELNQITTHTVPDGISFVTSNKCAYIAVELFCPANEWTYTAKEYQKKVFGINNVTIMLTADTNPSPLYNISWENLSEWRSGNYKSDTGLYAKTPKTRICTYDYLFTTPNATFKVSLSNNDYRLLVAQYDSSYHFISSETLANDEFFTTDTDCSYLTITLYSPSLEWTLNYASYQDLFNNGFSIALSRTLNIDDTDVPTTSLLPTKTCCNSTTQILICILLVALIISQILYKRKHSH